MSRPWIVLVLVTGLTSGCGLPAADAERLAPPPAYARWFAATESCAGLAGDFSRIEFYAVPGAEFDCPTGRCAGRWESPNRIYVARRWVHDEMVVRHEMLHALVGRAGHPARLFGETGCRLTWETWTGAAAVVAAAPVSDGTWAAGLTAPPR